MILNIIHRNPQLSECQRFIIGTQCPVCIKNTKEGPAQTKPSNFCRECRLPPCSLRPPLHFPACLQPPACTRSFKSRLQTYCSDHVNLLLSQLLPRPASYFPFHPKTTHHQSCSISFYRWWIPKASLSPQHRACALKHSIQLYTVLVHDV